MKFFKSHNVITKNLCKHIKNTIKNLTFMSKFNKKDLRNNSYENIFYKINN